MHKVMQKHVEIQFMFTSNIRTEEKHGMVVDAMNMHFNISDLLHFFLCTSFYRFNKMVRKDPKQTKTNIFSGPGVVDDSMHCASAMVTG